MTKWTPAKVLDAIVNLDKRVHFRGYHSQHTPWKPVGGIATRLPRDYKQWEAHAKTEEVDLFWYLITKGLWRHAKKVSGLPQEVIDAILFDAFADAAFKGKASPETAYVHDIRLSTFLHLVSKTPLYRLFNLQQRFSVADLDGDERRALDEVAAALSGVSNTSHEGEK